MGDAINFRTCDADQLEATAEQASQLAGVCFSHGETSGRTAMLSLERALRAEAQSRRRG